MPSCSRIVAALLLDLNSVGGRWWAYFSIYVFLYFFTMTVIVHVDVVAVKLTIVK